MRALLNKLFGGSDAMSQPVAGLATANREAGAIISKQIQRQAGRLDDHGLRIAHSRLAPFLSPTGLFSRLTEAQREIATPSCFTADLVFLGPKDGSATPVFQQLSVTRSGTLFAITHDYQNPRRTPALWPQRRASASSIQPTYTRALGLEGHIGWRTTSVSPMPVASDLPAVSAGPRGETEWVVARLLHVYEQAASSTRPSLLPDDPDAYSRLLRERCVSLLKTQPRNLPAPKR